MPQWAEFIAESGEIKGIFVRDTAKLGRAPQELMGSPRMFDLGCQSKYDFREDLKNALTWFTANITSVRS